MSDLTEQEMRALRRRRRRCHAREAQTLMQQLKPEWHLADDAKSIASDGSSGTSSTR